MPAMLPALGAPGIGGIPHPPRTPVQSPGGAGGQPKAVAVDGAGNVYAAGWLHDGDAETVAYDPQGTIVSRARWSDTAASHELISGLDVDAAGRAAITGTTAENPSPYVAPTPVTLRYDSGGRLLQTIRDGGSSVDIDADELRLREKRGGPAYVARFQ
jgi:hypothetical protein